MLSNNIRMKFDMIAKFCLISVMAELILLVADKSVKLKALPGSYHFAKQLWIRLK